VAETCEIYETELKLSIVKECEKKKQANVSADGQKA